MEKLINLSSQFWLEFGQDVLVGISVLAVSGFVWLITSQMIFNAKTSKSIIETNNNLSGAITSAASELRVALASLKQQNDDQRLICEYHRKQTEDVSRRLSEVRGLIDHLFEIIHVEKPKSNENN